MTCEKTERLPIGHSTALDGTLILDVAADTPLTQQMITVVDRLCAAAESAPSVDSFVLLRLHGDAVEASEDCPDSVHLVGKWEHALRRMERLPVAVVATATGHCVDRALELLLVADFRIAGPDCTLGVRLGTDGAWPGMALYRLANHLGTLRSRAIVMFGRPVSASQALAAGLLDEVTTDSEQAVAAVAAVAKAVPGRELAIRRRLLLDAVSTGFEEAMGSHLAAVSRTLLLREAP